jgi:hypothetical protein
LYNERLIIKLKFIIQAYGKLFAVFSFFL